MSMSTLKTHCNSNIGHCTDKHIANITDGLQSHQMLSTPTETPHETTKYVIDGGSWLNRMPWKTGVTYGCIASSYADITVKRYGSVTIVFDGYSASTVSVKDGAPRRRGINSTLSLIVNFSTDTPFIGKKGQFLQNAVKKTKITHLIGNHLSSKGYHIIYVKNVTPNFLRWNAYNFLWMGCAHASLSPTAFTCFYVEAQPAVAVTCVGTAIF